MGNLKQTELQRTEERKAEDRSEKDRTRRITKKLQEEKKLSSETETALGHSQKIEAKCCRKLKLEKVVTNKHHRLAVET